MKEQITTQIDDIFSLWSEDIRPGGQVLVQQGGETVYERCFGYADIENRIPVTVDTTFHVASVSKQFTVMLLMLLAREGLVDLDSDIKEYVGEYVSFPDRVTVRDLMNNSSGIRDIFELLDLQGICNDDIVTQDHALRVTAKQRAVNFPPRSRYSYSNTNFILLAAIAEKVTGVRFAELMKERVFVPLGMEHSAIRDKYWTCLPHRAKSFIDNGTELFYNPLDYGLYGATCLNTTARDLAKWMRNYKAHIICPEDVIREMTTVTPLKDNAPTTYACGLWAGEAYGRSYIIHVGEDAGFRSVTLRLIEDDLDIIILANTQNTLTDPSAWKIARILLGLPKAAEQPSCDRDDLSDPAGFYYAELPNSAIVKVSWHNGGLFWKEKYGQTPLTRVRGNLFRAGRLETFLLLGEDAPMLYTPEETIRLCKAVDEAVPEELGWQYAGRYYSEELETLYTVAYENGELYLDHLRRGRSPLHPLGGGRFVTEHLRSCFVQFVADSAGTVTGFNFSGVRVACMPLKKLDADESI